MIDLLYGQLRQSLTQTNLDRGSEPAPRVTPSVSSLELLSGKNLPLLAAAQDFGLDLIGGAGFEQARVLDLACGEGEFTGLLAERFPEYQVTGIDPSQTHIERARARSAGHLSLERLSFCRGEIFELGQIPDHFYHISTWTMAAHRTTDILQASRVLGEMARVTHPDGILLVMDLSRLKSLALTDWYSRRMSQGSGDIGRAALRASLAQAYNGTEFEALVDALAIPGLRHYEVFGLPMLQLLFRARRLYKEQSPVLYAAAPSPHRSDEQLRIYRQVRWLFRLSGLEPGRQRSSL